MLRITATDAIIIGTSRRLHAGFFMIIPSSLMCGSMRVLGRGGGKYKAALEELQYDLQSSILLPENNLSPHKSDL
jgi:hypothetical protein